MAVVRLEVLPPTSQTYWVADYIEFRCVVSVYHEYSASDLVSARRRARDLGSAVEGEEDGDGEPPVLPAPADDAEAADDHDPEIEDDARNAEAMSVWAHLRERAAAFADAYPFEIEGHDTIKLRQLTPARRFYLFLLIASSLRHIPESDRAKLTKPFEKLGVEVVRTHLPTGSEVHVFGTSAGSDGHYKGNLFKRLQTLAADLRLDLRVKKQEVSRQNVGDAGIDIVGWVPPGDEAANRMLMMFAQCTCSKDWQSKQGEATEQRWGVRLMFVSPLVNLMIIPFYYRSATGTWFEEFKVERGILVDRLRIIRRFQSAGTRLPVNGCYPASYINRCLSDEVDDLAA